MVGLRSERGGIAIHMLGVSLLLLLLVGGMGLAETARAMAVKAAATRSLAAALQSAARHPDPADRKAVERLFRQTLKANLGGLPHTAELRIVPAGGRDPVTDRRLDRPVLVAHLTLEHRLAYLGRWLPAIRLEVAQTAPGRRRNGTP